LDERDGTTLSKSYSN